MLKIFVVLATTFVFAGLLIAHPSTSPSVEIASDAPKVKLAQVPAAAPVRVAEVEQSQQPAALQDAPVISRPETAAPVAPVAVVAPAAPRPVAPVSPAVQPQTQLVATDVGTIINQVVSTITARPAAPAAAPAVRQPTYAGATPPGPRNDGRHRSHVDAPRMQADAIRAQDEAMPGHRPTGPVYHRPVTATRQVEVQRRAY
jgi:hypothetical protein